ncbi:mitochondrial carrier domain-containing protein [Dimargaris cristalligena]|uniref:Mitochondrial carrier domain-containing protein n=1 Tax=Dimargaris cristalligena TaxID=215637 RepID=A0A4P9ZTD8_9FUNG|nr:mitochondrial carrier domain-containing protein [Dimargaris cristalligena]|eukprot:RKP36478.1 mitochondrial carrier domain-containing protein [Dimargaris cristalligena]
MAKPSKEALPPFGQALTGAASAALALLLVYPLDTIKTRMQNLVKGGTGGEEQEIYHSVWDAATKIYQREGIRGFYAGLGAGLMGQTSTNFAYFYWYSFIRSFCLRQLQQRQRRRGPPGGGAATTATPTVSLSTAAELALGALAAALAQLFTIPISVIATRQQTAPTRERLSVWGTAREIIADDGWAGLWKGLKPSLVLVVNPSITYGAFERIKTVMLAQRPLATTGASLAASATPLSLSALQVFVAGALSKTLATIVTYPYIMAKVRLQWKPSKSETKAGGSESVQAAYTSAVDVLRKVWQIDGFTGWYKGMQAQISKAMLTQALLLMIKDKLESYVMLMFALLRTLQKQKRI